ncbi:CbrC family protein [Spirosoma sp. BT702]|uniref:CbrC family protein n=1 Tax=Spirosoma profusum TaxID=2771354 RepID=A0A926Y056_9BACT|nr:CbrC family protein [Spirosoma profusum]MBD2704153.1 CbrC family protein [Spirosoma profusum]
MDFKYFANPELYVGFLADKVACTGCDIVKECFDATGFYGQEKIDAICTDCLGNGKLIGRSISTCEGDATRLKQQLRQLNPSLSWPDIANVVKLKTDELEKTTPQLVTWQDWLWPCSDGDYCRFIGYGSQVLYKKIAHDGRGKRLFIQSLTMDSDDVDADELWDEYLPEKEIKDYQDSSDHSTLFYVFKSLHSDEIKTIWDTE